MTERIAELLEPETAGDPMSGLKWTRKTTANIAAQLRRLAITVSPHTVWRLLKDMGFSLRVNQKTLASASKNPPSRKVRNQQFEYISQIRGTFASRGSPIISVDTKKKELIGRFKNNGTAWGKEVTSVNDHDFRSDADGFAVPYGIYDTRGNLGFVAVGTSHDTPAFAVDSIILWWTTSGSKLYPKAAEILILADGGGSNSARSRVWKYRLQHRFCNRFRLSVTVCHYPPGASKWNPIEHRLFAQITRNWAANPLVSLETVLKCIRKTTTSTGLRVKARLIQKNYAKGERIRDEEMEQLALVQHKTLPAWNYSLVPSSSRKM